MKAFTSLHNRAVSRSEIEAVVAQAKEENNTEVIYRLSKILNAYPDEQHFVINIKDYPAAPTALAGAHHTGDYREALDENGRLKKGWKFSNGQVVKVTPKKALDTPSTEENKENKLYKFIVVTGHNFLGIYSYNDPKIEGFWQTNTTDNGIQIFTAISKGKKITKKKGISLILQKYTEGKDFIFVEYDYASLNKYLLLLEKPILGLSAANDELTFLAAAGIDYFEQAPDDKAQGLGKPIPAADIYQMITDKVISMFKNAKASDYHRPWKDDAFFIPINFESKKPYRGVNRLLLQERIGFAGAFRNPYFLTFNQIKKHGGRLKKGTRGYEVVYYSIRYIVPADKNTGRKAYSSTNAHKVIDFIDKHKLSEDIVTRIPMIRYYNVYNGASIEGIDFQLDKLQIGRAVPDTAPENQAAALIVENYPNPPAIKHEGNQAYYSPSGDYVKMPKKEQFDSINDYYRILFHELTHSTGHDKRLDRGIHLMLEKEDYAKEELVAEFGAVFLSAWAGIMWYTNKNHAVYLKNWNSAIKEAENDNKFLMRAASLAQAATDYILNLNPAGLPAFLSKYEKLNKKAEKPKPEAPKPQSSLYEAFSELLSQIKSTNADIPSNELEDFLYNFGSQHYIEKKNIYTFFYDKVTKPIGSLSAYKKHPLFTKVKNPQPHHAGYTTTKRGTEILNIFIKDFEALKQQYDYNHYSFTKFWNIATEKPKKKATKATEKADNTDKKYKFIAFYNSYGRINGIYSYQNLTINEFYLKNTFDDGIKVYAPLKSLEKIEEAKRIIEEQYIEGKDFICLKFESKKREEYYSLLIHSNEKPKPQAPKATEKFPAAGTTKVFFTSQVDEIVDYVKKNGDNRGYINIDFTDKQTLKLLSQYGWGTYGFINTYDYPESAPKSKTKGVMSLKKIVSTDKLRIQITGVYIDSDYYIATNAISLIWVPRPKNDEYKTGWIFDANFKCKKLGGCKIEDYLINSDRFPIDRIREMQKAPIAYTSQQIDLTTLLDHLYRGYKAIRAINSTQEAIVITLQADKKIQYIDLKILIDLLDALRTNGAQTITFGFENLSGNSPIHISTDTQLQGFVMPRIFDENKVPTVKNCLMIAPLPLTLTEISKPTKGLSAPTDGTLFGSLPIFKTLKEAKKYFKAWAYTHLRGKKVFHKELDKYVVFSSKGIDHVLSSKISLKKMYLIQQAEEMLKNSHLIAFVEDYKKRDNIKGAYRMRTTATFEGEEVKVILTLREGENGVVYYDHKIEEIEESTTPPRKSHANPFCGDSAPTNIPAKTVPNTSANQQINRLAVPTVYVEHLPEETNQQISTSANQNTLDAKMAALQTRNWETFVIANPQLQRFLGDVERKTSESTVITIAGGAGSGKTRFAFQFINALAQNYKVGHASLEEHPDSKLYYDKVQQYIDETALPNIEAPEINNLEQLEALIQRNEVIVIDSFAKLRELDSRFMLDRDLRKKYNGKLFLIIYQLTGDSKMRGGSESEFDGDIILLTHVSADYRENYIYPKKNRYNAIPATQLRYSSYYQQMLDIPQELGTGSQPTEAISLPPAPQTNVYEVIY